MMTDPFFWSSNGIYYADEIIEDSPSTLLINALEWERTLERVRISLW
jgi:hypothetical protein